MNCNTLKQDFFKLQGHNSLKYGNITQLSLSLERDITQLKYRDRINLKIRDTTELKNRDICQLK